MNSIQYNKFISLISEDEVVGKLAVKATELLIHLDKKDLKEEDFELIDSFITVTRTSMTNKESNHIDDILDHIRTKGTK
jgi:hypothetical protein